MRGGNAEGGVEEERADDSREGGPATQNHPTGSHKACADPSTTAIPTMPSHSSLTSSEKSLIKKHAPTSSGDKIHSAAIGRIYYAFPDPTKWSYSGISGAVVFGWGQAGGWLKVVDLAVSAASLSTKEAGLTIWEGQGTRGVVWQHTVVEDMPYYQDRTFFHTFPSDVSSARTTSPFRSNPGVSS